jgi:hypothetical protein
MLEKTLNLNAKCFPELDVELIPQGTLQNVVVLLSWNPAFLHWLELRSLKEKK